MTVAASITLNGSSPSPRRLYVGVISCIVIVALGLAEYLSHFINLDSPPRLSRMEPFIFLTGGVIAFATGLCGIFCGASLLFRLNGLPRLVALLTMLVSLYAIVHCLGFFGWAINLP